MHRTEHITLHEARKIVQEIKQEHISEEDAKLARLVIFLFENMDSRGELAENVRPFSRTQPLEAYPL
jgi:predicted nuclease of restriction endonuclease-like RecB superfamily